MVSVGATASRARGQSTVEFGASALVLVLLVFGLVDLGRVFYFDVGLQGATREGARQATWFDNDGNAAYNPPYADAAYPGGANQPSLFICYANSPGLDLAVPPTDNSFKGADVNIILVMNFGFVSGLMSGVLGNSIHIVSNTHMTVGGY